jgi:hypothetical protein
MALSIAAGSELESLRTNLHGKKLNFESGYSRTSRNFNVPINMQHDQEQPNVPKEATPDPATFQVSIQPWNCKTRNVELNVGVYRSKQRSIHG